MTRPGFVLDVDRTTPPLLFWRGEQLTTERLPTGSRVIYAPEPVAALEDPDREIRTALEAPTGSEPLRSLLHPEMRLTIAFDGVGAPLPRMRRPDNRQRVIEAVLDIAAAAGVDDVVLVVARGLNRRMTEPELRHVLGDRIYDAFAPHGALRQHDAEDSDNLVRLADDANAAEVNRRAAESDLLVNVSILDRPNQIPSPVTGLAGTQTVRHHNDPTATPSELHQRVGSTEALFAQSVRTFQISTTVHNKVLASPLSVLQKREWEWTLKERAIVAGIRRTCDLSTPQVNRKFFNSLQAPYAMTSVFAGDCKSVADRAGSALTNQQLVAIDGQSDIVTLGVSFLSPYSVTSIMNPVLVAVSSIGDTLNAHTGTPVVREGGVAIIQHPTRWEFDTSQHPSYLDFFDEVLTATADSVEMEKRFEERFATDPWYVHLYRTSYTYHGVHPFHVWYRCSQMLAHLGGVIVVGGDTNAVRRLGFKPASTFQDAMEMARDITGQPDPSLTQIHTPPPTLVDVK